MKKIWTKSLPSVYNTWFHGALLQENNYLKYYFFYPSNIFPISDITFDIDSGEIINCNQNIDDVQKNKECHNTRKPPKHQRNVLNEEITLTEQDEEKSIMDESL